MDWIKIKCNLLDHRKIKMIRKGPEGNTLVLLWLLVLIEAGKCNRGGYLMVSSSLPYTCETLSLVTDISLPTVRLGLGIFEELDMLDQQDGVLFVKNWRKYQSEDKLEVRRAKDRLRQQRHRENERSKILTLPPPDLSRDHHVRLTRDVTMENREEQSRKVQTTDTVRCFLQDTPLSRISDHDLQDLQQRHGIERLLEAADIAAETWRRKGEDPRNPGGYLQTVCASLAVPEWYVPFAERQKRAKILHQQKEATASHQKTIKAQEEAACAERNALWSGLAEEDRERFRSLALAELPVGVNAAAGVVQILAKIKAWEVCGSS